MEIRKSFGGYNYGSKTNSDLEISKENNSKV